jgi:hypothetical protein
VGMERSREARALTQTVFCPAWLKAGGKSRECRTRCLSQNMKCFQAVSFPQLLTNFTIYYFLLLNCCELSLEFNY